MPKFITTELTKAAALSLSCSAPSSVREGTGLIRGYRERKGHRSKREKLEEDPRESWDKTELQTNVWSHHSIISTC